MIEELRMQGDLLTGISLKNGGTFRVEKNYMQGSPYCCQITLSSEECERSKLAMDAIKRLKGVGHAE